MYMLLLVAGLLAFLGVHSLRMIAPAWRRARIAAMGERRWKRIYALLSLAGLVVLVWGYAGAQPLAPVLYVTPFWLVYVAVALMAFAFVSLAVSVLRPGRLRSRLKHPTLIAVKIWALAHLLVNGDLASVLLFAAFLAWAVWNRIDVKRRGEATGPQGPAFNDLVAVVAGLALWVLFIWKAHEWVSGVPVPIA